MMIKKILKAQDLIRVCLIELNKKVRLYSHIKRYVLKKSWQGEAFHPDRDGLATPR